MRAIFTAVWLLAGAIGSSAADRSFTLDGIQYVLEFPPDIVFTDRWTSNGREYIEFSNKREYITITSSSEKILEKEPVSTKEYIKNSKSKKHYFIKSIVESGYYFRGGCVSGPFQCFYAIQSFFPEHEKWLVISVVCDCMSETQSETTSLAEHLAAQLRGT